LAVDWTESQGLQILKPYQANRAIVAAIETTEGQTVNLSGEWWAASPTTKSMLDFHDTLRELKGREFDLFLYSDRGFRDCVLESISLEYPANGGGRTVFQANIFCPEPGPTTAIQLSFSDYNLEYPYAAEVGRPTGDAASGGGTVSGQPVLQTVNLQFPNVQDAVGVNGQEIRWAVGGETGRTWRVISVQVAAAEPAEATGASSFKVSAGSVAAASGFVECTVGQNAHFGSVQAGTLDVLSGSTLYAWCSVAGGHANVQVAIVLRLENA
jgi:hypothetical protein